MKLLVVLGLLVCAVACKPPKFNQKINCAPANFSASGVAVLLDGDYRYIVIYPDGRIQQIGRESCVVGKIQ